jgi:hypothetical protein
MTIIVSLPGGGGRVILLRGLAVWAIIRLAEVAHGAVRGVWLEPLLGDFRARQIAVITGAAIIVAIAMVFVRWLGARRVYQLLGVGLLWLVLMLGFEIGFGRFVMGYSWERVGSDYNLLQGGLLPIGMLVLAAAPLIAAKLRGLI